jgi:CDP-paratose 2-epimerase
VAWLHDRFPGRFEVEIGDIRDERAVRRVVEAADHIYHFAAQVAVTTSLTDPVSDFEVNARGTLNVLEAMRRSGSSASLIVTSTNKVYGALDDVDLVKEGQRYTPANAQLRENGVSEARALDFHSPYGCSKGAADQYVLDYARSYGMAAIVFRMSCIYGPHQFGNEDQGWVAHFLIRARQGNAIVIYGDGCQVRDVLYVEDLLDALTLGCAKVQSLKGRAFNIGGGPRNTVSLLELIRQMEGRLGHRLEVEFGDWRQGDQRYYVTDTRRFESLTGWRPRTAPAEGLGRLDAWLEQLSAVTPARAAPTYSKAEV